MSCFYSKCTYTFSKSRYFLPPPPSVCIEAFFCPPPAQNSTGNLLLLICVKCPVHSAFSQVFTPPHIGPPYAYTSVASFIILLVLLLLLLFKSTKNLKKFSFFVSFATRCLTIQQQCTKLEPNQPIWSINLSQQL